MDHVHDHQNPKRQRRDESYQPCVRQTVGHNPMLISSLVDQRAHRHLNTQSTEHSTSYNSVFIAHHQTRDSATTISPSLFSLLKQSSSQPAQPFEARCATPARHFRPWETSGSCNLSSTQDSATSFTLCSSHNAPTLLFQEQDIGHNLAPSAYRNVPSPRPDLSSADRLLSSEDDCSERDRSEAQDSNTFVPKTSVTSQTTTEQSVMVCFGMVSSRI